MLSMITELFFMSAMFGAGWFGHMIHVWRKKHRRIA